MESDEVCTVCREQPVCLATFKSVVEAMGVANILTEYSALSDAWRIVQAVALYNEYKGVGGAPKSLYAEPRPCFLCMVKIVNVAQAVFVLSTTLDAGSVRKREEEEHRPPRQLPLNLKGISKLAGGDQNGSGQEKDLKVTKIVNITPSVPRPGRDSVCQSPKVGTEGSPSLNPSPKRRGRPKRVSGRSIGERNPGFQVEQDLGPPQLTPSDNIDCAEPLSSESNNNPAPPSHSQTRSSRGVKRSKSSKDVSEEEKDSVSENRDGSKPPKTPVLPPLSRPRRSGGRSFHERNPDFSSESLPVASGPPASLILSGKEVAKTEDKKGPTDKSTVTAIRTRRSTSINEESLEIHPASSKVDGVEEDDDDISPDLRTEQLARLDAAVSGAGWSRAVRSGSNMEREVFTNSSGSKAQYLGGIERLVRHFNTQPEAEQANEPAPRARKTPARSINDEAEKWEVKTKAGDDEETNGLATSNEKKVSGAVVEKPAAKKEAGGPKVKKVSKVWSKNKLSCPQCGETFSRLKLSEHLAEKHGKVAKTVPLASEKARSSVHISRPHADLDPEYGSISGDTEGSEESLTSLNDRDFIKDNHQRTYILKTSKSGKMGRKYINVEQLNLEEDEEEIIGGGESATAKSSGISVSSTAPLQKVQVNNPEVAKPRKTTRISKPTKKIQEAMGQNLVGVVNDEFSPSNSESESVIKANFGTLNAYIDTSSKENVPEDQESNSSSILRPQRRKRSLEDRNPDFEVSLPAKTKSSKILEDKKKVTADSVEDVETVEGSKQIVGVPPRDETRVDASFESEKDNVEDSPSVARNWFEINKEEEF